DARTPRRETLAAHADLDGADAAAQKRSVRRDGIPHLPAGQQPDAARIPAACVGVWQVLVLDPLSKSLIPRLDVLALKLDRPRTPLELAADTPAIAVHEQLLEKRVARNGFAPDAVRSRWKHTGGERDARRERAKQVVIRIPGANHETAGVSAVGLRVGPLGFAYVVAAMFEDTCLIP